MFPGAKVLKKRSRLWRSRAPARWLLLGFIFGASLPAKAQTPTPVGCDASLVEGFEDVPDLLSNGWLFINNSSPMGSQGWVQGNSDVFWSHAGTPESYADANFNSVGNGPGPDTISNWILLPSILLREEGLLSFYTRTVDGAFYPDRLEVRLSTSGSSTNVGTGPFDVGDFDILLLEINPSLAVGGYPEAFVQHIATLTGQVSGPTQGRLAFRYFVENAGDIGGNSSFIGIDTVDYVACGGAAPTSVPTRTPTPLGGTGTSTPTPTGGVGTATPTPTGGIMQTVPAPGNSQRWSVFLMLFFLAVLALRVRPVVHR